MRLRITINGREKPFNRKKAEELEWLCSSFGFCQDTQQKTASDVFKKLAEHAAKGEPLSSTELSGEVGMSRGAVIHQLNRLAAAGLIRKEGRRYMLRESGIHRTIKELQRDVDRIFEDLEEIALELDEQMGFGRRKH